jgi:hypothetical protein
MVMSTIRNIFEAEGIGLVDRLATRMLPHKPNEDGRRLTIRLSDVV